MNANFFQLLSALLLCSAFQAVAQYGALTTPTGEVMRETERYPEVSGSPFYCEDFIRGTVYLSNGALVENALLNYDAYADKLTYLETGKKRVIATNSVSRFVMDGSCGEPALQAVFKSGYEFGDYDKQGFFQVLYEGEHLSLLKKTSVEIVDTPVPGTNGAQVDKVFVRRERYFLLDEDGAAQRIRKLNKKHVLRAFSEPDKLKKYVSAANLDLGLERDVASLTAYYDQHVLKP